MQVCVVFKMSMRNIDRSNIDLDYFIIYYLDRFKSQ